MIAICTLLVGAGHLVKMIILGDYLMIIENKVNTVLKAETKKYGFGGRVLAWEWWRIKEGYARKGTGVFSVISFSVIILVLISFVSLLCAFFRWKFIRTTNSRIWLILLITVGVLWVVILVHSLMVIASKREMSREHYERSDVLVAFNDLDKHKKQSKKKMEAVLELD